MLNHRVGKTKLSVEFERSGLHGKCARCRSRFPCFVDNPDAHAESR
jgi:hypothetical protein